MRFAFRPVALILIQTLILPPRALAGLTYQDVTDVVVRADLQDPLKETLPKEISEKHEKTFQELRALLTTIGEEKKAASKNQRPFQLSSDHQLKQRIDSVHVNVRQISDQISPILNDPKIPPPERLNILKTWINELFLPLVQLHAVLGKEDPWKADQTYFNSLLPRLPKDFKKDQLEDLGLQTKSCSADSQTHPLQGPLEVVLDPIQYILADSTSTQYALTKDNYLRSLKLTTLSMILTQLSFHRQLSGDPSPISVPESCRKTLTPDLPESIQVPELDPTSRDSRFESFMSKLGLDTLSPPYAHAFVQQEFGKPSAKTLLGYAPFEKYHAAQRAQQVLKEKERIGNYASLAPIGSLDLGEPAIQDADAFDAVIKIRTDALLKALSDRAGLTVGESVQLFNDYLGMVAHSEDPKYQDSKKELALKEQLEANEHLFKLQMDRAPERFLIRYRDSLNLVEDQGWDWDPEAEEAKRRVKLGLWLNGSIDADLKSLKAPAKAPPLISKKLRNQLKKNQVTLDFPPATSPIGYRRWAVKQLTAAIQDRILPKLEQFRSDRDKQGAFKNPELVVFLRQLANACGAETKQDPTEITCPGLPKGKNRVWDFFEDLLAKVQKYQFPDRSDGDGLGPLTSKERSFFDGPLANSWFWLVKAGQLPEATLSEWDLMKSQMAENPFTAVRLTLLMDIEEAEREAKSEKVIALKNTLKVLELEGPVKPYHANRILSPQERLNFWKQTEEKAEADHRDLYSASASGINP
ncbi:MAG: hypothetical protein ACK5QT_09130, partial [Oligoflexia bacterium]